MSRIKPMLDDFELENVQKVEIDNDRVFLQHQIPALEGDFFQGLGRRATSVSLTGVMTGTEAGEKLETLRQKYRAAEPVPFVSDIMSATRIDRVLIQTMGIREVAGKPERFEYALSLREYIEAPPISTREPPQPVTPPPPSPAPAIDEDQGTLIVEVIAEDQPGFDFGEVTLTAQGQDEDGDPASHSLTNRSDNIWTEEAIPAGDHRIEAETTGIVSMAGSVAATISPGQTTTVTLSLSRVVRTADVFVISFRFDNSFIEPCMRHVMREVAQHATDNPTQKLLIVGHTDKSGSSAYNQSLSERRARSAYAYLVFGRSRQEALDEWFALRQRRTPGTLPSNNDSWDVIEYQHMLQDLGFYPGPINGTHDSLTGEAVEAFRCSAGLAPGTTVDDPTWEVLIEAYLVRDALSIPEAQLFPNAGDGCDGGRVKWIGCGEEHPLPLPQPPKASGHRPYRRVELIFVNAPVIPCPVPRPVTFELPEPGSVGGSWCLDPAGSAGDRCCFATRDCAAATDEQWCLQDVNATRITVRGSIRNEGGPPHSRRQFVLIASDGTFKGGESAAGRPVPANTRNDGSFEFDALPVGVYSVEVIGRHLVRLEEAGDGSIKGNQVCKRLNSDADRLDIVVIDAPLMRQKTLPVAAHLMTALHPTTREVRTCPAPSGAPANQATAHGNDEIRAAFDGANVIWRQGRVRFELIDLVHEAYALLPRCEVGHDEFITLMENCAYGDVVNVFFLGDLAGQGEAGFGTSPEGGAARNVSGCAVGDRIQGTLIGQPVSLDLSAEATEQVLAHELGHYLNLPHVEVDGRLMIPSTDPFSGDARTLIDAEVGTARASRGATVKCLPLSLVVSGAQRVGGSLSDHFIAIENPSGTITVAAEIPDRLLAPEQGALVMTGGNPGANDRQRLVPTAAGTTEVEATYTPLNGRNPSSKSVRLRVATFELSVTGAAQAGTPPSGDFLAGLDANLVIRVSTVLVPAPFCLPSDLVVWQGGDAVVDPLAHTVSRAAQARTTVSATVAGVTRSVSISVITLELDALGAVPSGTADNTFLTVVDPAANATIIAEIDPQPAEPPDPVDWTGGDEAPDPMQRLVSKAAPGTVIVLAQVAGIAQQVNVVVATFTLTVQGATEIGAAGSGNFVAIQAAAQNATVNAQINPLPNPIPPNFIAWTGGTPVAGNPLSVTASLANTGPQPISATVTGTTRAVTINVVTFSLTVRGAVAVPAGGTAFFAAAEDGQNVTIEAQINPAIASPPANLVTWVGGTAVAGNPLQRTVPKTAGINPVQVSASVAGTTQTVNITVFTASLRVEDPIVQLQPLPSTRFFITRDPAAVVTINLLTLPLLPSPLPANFVDWTNGTAVPGNQERRTLTRGTARTTVVTATITGTSFPVTITVFTLRMINMANVLIPTTGNDACLMVSNFVTSVNLPPTATFIGPRGAAAVRDPDTFRVQLAGLPTGETPDIRLDVRRSAATPSSHVFNTVEGALGGSPVYRTNEHIRLTSNSVDNIRLVSSTVTSAPLAHQTPIVRLEDVVRATLVINGQDITFSLVAGGPRLGHFELQVGRPPAENGPKATRTADIHFITLTGIASDPTATIARMNEDWAQLAIRFNLLSPQDTVTPVQNVLTIDLPGNTAATTAVAGQLSVDIVPPAAQAALPPANGGFINNLLIVSGVANADGQLEVDITPAGGALVHIALPIANGQVTQQIAGNLAAAISAQAGLTATAHQSQADFLILVNHGLVVTIANPTSNVAPVNLQTPAAGSAPAFTVVTAVAVGQTEIQIAANLAADILALPVIDDTASLLNSNQHIVMVNARRNMGFANLASSVPTLVFQVPLLNFGDGLSFLEGSVLALNFGNPNRSIIEIFAVSNNLVVGARGRAGADVHANGLPGWHNRAFLIKNAVDFDDALLPFTAGHEVGHILLNAFGTFPVHHPTSTNLLKSGTDTVDTINASKRLDDAQNSRARAQSGPGSPGPLLLNQR